MAAGMHIAPDNAVHATRGAEGIGVLGAKIVSQVLVTEGEFEFSLLAEVKSHD